jgi:hypothetical protein
MNDKTRQAVAELRHGSPLVALTTSAFDQDPVARELIADGFRRLYGFEWPAGLSLAQASTQLFNERMAFWKARE